MTDLTPDEQAAVNKASSPTSRTFAVLRVRGLVFQQVEYWHSFAQKKIDLFGVIDIVAIAAGQIIGIQCTDDTNHSKRADKARAEPRLIPWLNAGAAFEIWSWGKRGARGEKKTWTLRIESLRAEDVCETTIAK